MPTNTENICSVAAFQRQTQKHLRRLKKSGQPLIVTLNRRAVVVVQSVKGYQELLDRADLSESIRVLRKRVATPPKDDIPAVKALADIRIRLGLK